MTEPALTSEIRFITLAGMLRLRAAERPAQVAFTFLADGGDEARLTYGDLDGRARAIAAALRQTVAPGERALLLYPPGLDFIAAFFGCLYAGVVAVPAYPPRPNDRSQTRLRSITRDAGPRAALTTSSILAGVEGSKGFLTIAPELAPLRWIPTDVLEVCPDNGADLLEPDPESLAFLQYTSGSTADPKGVRVTHANLVHNERMIGAAFGMDEDSVVVGWLPLYHDMGLIGNVLQPLHAGGRCVLMSPVAFLQRPLSWLEAISRYRGTVSGGPNFAYELCVRKAAREDLTGLDLSSWRVAFNGAEPVRASTLERFAETFAPCGFRPAAFYPCYGLAEATLFVTGGVRGRRPRVAAVEAVALERNEVVPAVAGDSSARWLVSCGQSWMGQRLVVANPETGTICRPGRVGEIWIAGPSVADGYWSHPEATERDFNAFLLEGGEGPFLRTGDLGFLAGGELYVTGRLKDLVILRGRNHYPQDLELTAERSHPNLRPGNGAAFSVEVAGEERLVIVHEVERHRRDGIETIAEAVRRAVAEEHEVQVHEVVLLKTGGLPKTSSGKVQRGLCRRLYLAGELPVVGRSALAGAYPAPESGLALTRDRLAGLEAGERRPMLAAYLRERAAAALRLPSSAVPLEAPLTGLGLDSLAAVELRGGVEDALGLSVPLADLLSGASLQEVAERILADLDATGAEVPSLRALSLEGDQPLSWGQRGLWFLHRLAPEGGAYNIAVAARTRGLDPSAFRRAMAALTARHEVLRTVFIEVAEKPVQRVLPELAPDVEVVDAGEVELAAILAEEAWRPFDLETGPLLRARLFLQPSGEWVVLLAVHHIVADFASLAVLARDLSSLYLQETGGPAAALDAPILRYSDFVHWQAAVLAGPRGTRLWDSWRERLAAVPDLDLPTDRPRPPVQTYRGGAQAAILPPALANSLRRWGTERGATLFMTLLAAFETQLARYTGQEDFAVGAPAAGRPLPELAGLAGYFVNALALRADLSGEPSFEKVLERAREAALDGLEHGDFPFALLAERLRPVRDPARSPLFQVMFLLQDDRPQDPPGLAAFALGEDGARLELGGLVLESVRLPERRAQLDLTLRVAGDGEGGLGLSLEHNADLFDAGTAERMLGHFRVLLEGVAADPGASVWGLPILTPAERGQIFGTWNDTARTYPQGLLMHELFEAQVERTPGAEALVTGDLRLTYEELNRRANQLAHHLRGLGVQPEARVGVCLRRTVRLVPSLLAVLKAGGAYVPLDPSYPRERLELLVRDSGAQVIVTETGTAPGLGEDLGVRRVLLDAEAGDESAENPERLGVPGNLAYLIYTSGSTGTPKAVAIEHHSPVVLLHWVPEVFPPEELAGMLAATSIGFDISVFEIFGPLSWGGRVILAENALALPRLAAAGEVALVDTVPSAVAELLRAGGLPPSVRTVNLAGEAVPPALVEALAALEPRPRILNLYGPSEDTTFTTVAELTRGDDIPVGRPIANTRIVLLDARGELVPAGVPGEVFIAGEGLSRGYLDRPDMTAARYLPDPFSTEPGGRMYRVGDLARWRQDGALDYLGRLDHQVKIRGFRVELGEIESALARHSAVREAVVMARDEGDRGKRLVAYVVPRGVPASELRAFLKESLPDFMVPAAFVHMDALPLSPNGKVNRRALPDPGAGAAPLGTAAAFKTPTEELLAGVVAEILGLERVSPADSFFELGGHSLLATRLVSRVSRLFGVDLPVSAVFLHPTVQALAAVLAQARPGAVAPPILRVPREPGEGLPISFAQRRLWLLDRLEPGNPAYHIPGELRLGGPLDLAALKDALAEIIRRHEALRTVFRFEESEPVQIVLEGEEGESALPLADLSALPPTARAAEAERLVRQAAVGPFDLEAGPLVRLLALRLGAEEHRLVVALHHIVADGWSLSVLLSELADLYEAFAAGRPSPLPELPVQYADYAAWQREQLRGEALEGQIAWWREALRDVPGLDLPADRQHPVGRAHRGGTRTAFVPPGLAAGIGALARREGATLFMTLLAVFTAQLARTTGAPSVPVGSPVANRGRGETEGLIGFFVNTLVLHTPVADDPSFRGLLARVREVSLGAYAHQDVPFERLVEELRPERQMARNPLFQVAFLIEEPLPGRPLGAAAAKVLRVETGTAKFDLTLSILPEADGFTALLEYDASRFDPATADRLLGHWRTLLEGIAAGPETRLSDLPLITPGEAEQIRAWSGTVTEYPRGATIHELFEAEARRAPGAVALEMGDLRLTYAELDERANRLARRLRRLGVGLEAPVGLFLERSIALVVGMLGVLKAGGAYVPLDPSYPQERLSFLLKDTGIGVLVGATEAGVAAWTGPAVLLDRDGGMAGSEMESAEPLPPLAGPESLAYVIFTSGSTGRPKGVEVVHRGVVRLVLGAGYLRFSRHEVWLHLVSPSFDVATFEVWGALLNGSRLVVLPGTPTLAELGGVIARHGVTTLWLTAGLFHQVVEAGLASLRGVSQLMAGGDVLSPVHVRRALEALPGCTVIDGYGPTENTAFTTCQSLRDPAEVGETVPIGRPLSNTTVHVLDRNLRPVPVGAPGELLTGGDGVARGYRRRPDLTAERFVPDPFGPPGSRLYRTGDLVRWRPSGILEFLGRIDQQVKIRGFRVEPVEIEATLDLHPDVALSVVVPRDLPAAGKVLVAYLVPKIQDLETQDLPDFLRSRLPDYMVPALFVVLPELPLNASGKVDRRALAERGPLPEGSGAPELVAPRTPLEERLAAVWSQVLGVERVGIHDDFFALGGHSLLAIRMLAEAGDVLGFEMRLAELFEARTVAGLAERVTARFSGAGWTEEELADLDLAAPRRRAVRTASTAPGRPRTPMEEQLVRVWREVLGVERVGIRDDFFELGGHSLLASRVMMQLSRETGVDLPLHIIFESPTIEDLAQRVSEALEERRETPEDEAPTAAPAESFPLSFAQQRLWFIDRLEPGNPAYNLYVAVRLTGEMRTRAFLHALAEVGRRHEPLRTIYTQADGEPVQVVLPPAPDSALPFSRIDLTGLPKAARERALREVARDEAARPFDLACGPVARYLLLGLGRREHVLVASFHHIATDGWSMGVFFQEVAALYAAFSAGRRSPLPPPPVRYVDFAARQHQAQEGEALRRQLAYWRQQLAGAPVLELPTDRPRPASLRARGANRPVEVPAALVPALKAVGRGEGITLFMTLLAAFTALLSRIAGQDDLSVGLPVAGRNRPELERLIGFFVNTLVLRGRLEDDPTFEDLVRRVRDGVLAAQANQDVSFEKLVEDLQPERVPGTTPLFQVMFAFLASPLRPPRMPGLEVELLDVEAVAAKFDLTLSIHEWEGRLHGWLEYRADLFDTATIDRLLSQLRRLLTGAAADPSRRVSELPLLDDEERRQILEWAEGPALAVETEEELPVHRLFEERARTSPGALALEAGDLRLTYAELNARANRLAHHLRSLGVGPEVRVAVCLERSPELVASLLAVLKAGGAYVPLDPEHPQERLELMISDSGAAVLVTHGDRLDGIGGLPVVRWEALPAADEADPQVSIDPGNLAYVIYTSGSTGRPKGVGVSHSALAGHVAAVRRYYGLTTEDRLLHFASPSFDVAVEQVLPGLATGATLVLRGSEVWGAEELTGRITALGLTVVNLPTAVWQLWAQEAAALESAPPSLRLLIVGGEEMLPEAARLWQRSPLSGVRLLNDYGPTEAVITATAQEMADATILEGRPVSIGLPLPGRSVHVLDRFGNPVPVGTPGELCLGGLLARGYLGDPGRTAERFVPDPFGSPGCRLYRTGDLARRRPGGALEFLGRRDGQVKVRGFRIELGEVESALLAHPDVREAAVLAVPVDGGERRLAAWVVPAGERSPAAAALQGFLEERLPAYMVPAAFAFLEALPLTPNGKVDRRSLPAPEWGEAGAASSPRTEVEELLAGLWGGVLGVERVGVDDSFFDLGGHSLLATQLVSRVRAAFGVDLPLAALFAAPTPAALARRLAAAQGGPAAPAVVPVPRAPEGMPLSFSQRRLWFLHRLEPESPAYNVPGGLRLRGALRPEALAAALSEIVRRHESLRTVFRDSSPEALQVILPPTPAALPMTDLAGLPAEAREAEAWRLLGRDARQPFDLAAGPLLRAALLRLGPEDHVLSVSLHHIISDAWSMGITLRELAVLYQAFAADGPSPLPELSIQYADFSSWQRSWLSGEVLAGELAHWRRALAGAPETLELPSDRPRGASPIARAGQAPFVLPSGLASGLAALARRQGWTPFMGLLAAFDALLARYSGQRDLVVGAPIANRNRLETEGLIGFFTNTLALRLDLGDDPSFAEIGRRARAAALDAYAHQDLPFERLVEELAPERHLGRTPLFQVMLVLRNVPEAALELPGIAVEGMHVGLETAKFDLTLFLAEAAEGFTGSLEYNRDLFDPETADRLLGHFQVLLAGAVANPDLRLSDLPFLTPAEVRQLLDWGSNPVEHPQGGLLVHELVTAQAARTPDGVAVVSGSERLTYAGLTRRAGVLAKRLRTLGVGPDVPVGVFLERSPEMMVAVLAALEAGGAYLPLDPSYPAERLRLMVEDAGAPVVITGGALAETLPAGAHQVLRVDVVEGEEPSVSAGPAPAPGNLAYLIYTSGSTGRPKGVAMPHGAAVNMLQWQVRTSRAGEGTRTLQFAPLAFDVSFQEIFSTWISGGALVLVSEEMRRDAPALLRLLAAEEVERLFVPLVALQQLAVAAAEGTPTLALREVMAAGEQLYVTPQVRDLFLGLPGSVLHNHYGPSETHAATWLTLDGDPALWPERPSIGRPLDNARVFLLDAGLAPVPAGVPGDLFVGGAGLARGYLARPDLTAERFTPDPLAGTGGHEPGARLYRTGDLARWLPGGSLEFLGRADHQVKVRGYRIELSEVEAALARHPSVLQAVAAVRGGEGGAGAKRLVAYAVFREGLPAPAWSELKAFAAATLPDYMVPTVWVRLEELPLTPSGKVDRRALPAPEEMGSAGMELTPPSTPLEELLAGIWSDVLGVERIGVHDSFFDLGGHSLLATQVVSRLREACGVDLPLRRLFEAPTLAELARAVEAAGESAEPHDVEPIPPAPREGALPLSFAQERLWFLDRFQGGGSVYNVPLAVRMRGRLSPESLEAALREVVRRHEALRTVFPERDGEPAQEITPPESAAGWSLPRIDLSPLPAPVREAEAQRLALEESRRPFDLTLGPLFRAALVRLAAEEHLLLLNLHHVVSDLWSMGVLLREVGALYAAALAGTPSPLSELPVQYADFAAWQRRWLSGDRLERQMGYWRWQLQGLAADLELPADHPRPSVKTWGGAEHRFGLDGGLAGRLVALARREGATPFMVLASGLLTVLGRIGGQQDLAIGSPIANRNRIETEGLIGFFVNTLVLRADVGRARTFRDLLRQLRETTLGAYAHQDLPFEKLVEELHPQRDLSRTPFFQVMLALQNAPVAAGGLPGLTLAPEEVRGGTAKFDLSFAFSQEEGGGLAGILEYSTDLFEAATAARLCRHLATLLEAALADAGSPLASLPLLSAAERHQALQEWNDTALERDDDPTLHQLFEAQVRQQPAALAVAWEGAAVTYGELEARANRVARLLRGLGAGPGEPVGLWMERSPDMLAAVLGIVKAGAAYLPLDASWPAERVEGILTRCDARAIVTCASLLPAVEELKWRLPALADVVCLDVATERPEPEPLDPAEVRSLWDFISERATDRVSAGGFVSSYTGQPFSEAEVDEYRDRVVELAAPWIRPEARVLEIGCGSGLILWELAPRVARYVGLDPSELTQEKNRERAAREGLAHVELPTGFAHEIAGWEPGSFDLVILASTVQFFPGPVYLEWVLEAAVRLLAPGGAVLVADVLDARRQEEFRRSLAERAAAQPARVRSGEARRLSVDEGFFHDLAAGLPGAVEARVHHRRQGFANELRFRYDAVLTPAAAGAPAVPAERRKRLWTGWHAARQEMAPLTAAETGATAADVAYVIHTSGSTGAPKGIVVPHRQAVNLVRWVNETFEVGPDDRLLFVTSPCFDLSVYDIFGTLAAGAAVHVASEADLRDPERLARLLVEEPVTVWDSAPAALQQLAPLFPESPVDRLRLVLLSGDWIPVSLPGAVGAAFPDARQISLGGTTETTVWSNWYEIGEVDPRWASIPYGRPLANNRYYVLDGDLSPCPAGVAGDLHIGGESLSLGYANLPGMTAERYVPDPFSGRTGARMYSTGDRVRFGADGVMEFLGRVDFQVKIHGYRIELEEIEAALLRLPEVRDAVVLAREDVPGDKRLVAYVVPSRTPAPAPGELRAALQQTLPEYMVPWTFVPLGSLPLTTNGKVDRAALPAPLALAEGGAGYVAPRNEMERKIGAVWREILGLPQVGIHDNFFESGGSSLLIVKLHSRLKAALGVDVPVMELFRHPTIDALARHLAEEPQAEAPQQKTEAVRTRTRNRQEALRQLSQTRAQRRTRTE